MSDLRKGKFWIKADLSDGPELEALGIKLKAYDMETGKFRNCTADEEALDWLDANYKRWNFGPETK